MLDKGRHKTQYPKNPSPNPKYPTPRKTWIYLGCQVWEPEISLGNSGLRPWYPYSPKKNNFLAQHQLSAQPNPTAHVGK
jgi:hypothetical protein